MFDQKKSIFVIRRHAKVHGLQILRVVLFHSFVTFSRTVATLLLLMEITGTNAFNVQTNFGSYRPLREDRDYASKRLWDNTDDYNNLQVFLKGEGL